MRNVLSFFIRRIKGIMGHNTNRNSDICQNSVRVTCLKSNANIKTISGSRNRREQTFNALQYGVDLEIVGISAVSSFFMLMGLNSLLESTRRIQLNIYLFY